MLEVYPGDLEDICLILAQVFEFKSWLLKRESEKFYEMGLKHLR